MAPGPHTPAPWTSRLTLDSPVPFRPVSPCAPGAAAGCWPSQAVRARAHGVGRRRGGCGPCTRPSCPSARPSRSSTGRPDSGAQLSRLPAAGRARAGQEARERVPPDVAREPGLWDLQRSGYSWGQKEAPRALPASTAGSRQGVLAARAAELERARAQGTHVPAAAAPACRGSPHPSRWTLRVRRTLHSGPSELTAPFPVDPRDRAGERGREQGASQRPSLWPRGCGPPGPRGPPHPGPPHPQTALMWSGAAVPGSLQSPLPGSLQAMGLAGGRTSGGCPRSPSL